MAVYPVWSLPSQISPFSPKPPSPPFFRGRKLLSSPPPPPPSTPTSPPPSLFFTAKWTNNGLIWYGLTLHVQHTFFVNFFAVVLHGGLNSMWHIHSWNISHVTCKWSLTFKLFKSKWGKEMKEQQILLGTSAFPMAWTLWNSLAWTPKGSKDYEIKKKTGHVTYTRL